MTRKNVYLDNAATTPMDPKVIEKISSEMTNDFGNASSHMHLDVKHVKWLKQLVTN